MSDSTKLASEVEADLQQELEDANNRVGELEKQINDNAESIDSHTTGLLTSDTKIVMVKNPDGSRRFIQIHQNL